jgi:dethiobiotin synthetase
MLNALFITGTDSGSGKTVLTMALAAYWQTYCPSHPLGIMKPIQTGEGDRSLYTRLFALDQSLDEVNPLYFEAALPCPLAAERQGQTIKLEKAWQTLERLCLNRDWVLVEAVDGFGSPVTHETTVADLAWDWRLPTVLVVPVGPGAIAQAVANVALATQAKAHLKGIVLNCIQPYTDQQIAEWAPIDMIQSLTQKPVLGTIPYLSGPTDLAKLAQVASNLDLERLISLPIPVVS